MVALSHTNQATRFTIARSTIERLTLQTYYLRYRNLA